MVTVKLYKASHDDDREIVIDRLGPFDESQELDITDAKRVLEGRRRELMRVRPNELYCLATA